MSSSPVTIYNKAIVTAQDVEFYYYEGSVIRGVPRSHRIDRSNKVKKFTQSFLLLNDDNKLEFKQRKEIIRSDSVFRTKTKLRRLINSNPDCNKFLTLTFKENIQNFTQANNEFKKFIKRLKRLYKKDIKYIAVPELQKRGAIHYHILLNINYIKYKELKEKWPNGSLNIKRINKIKNVGLYLVKYLTKDINNKFFSKKKYFTSRNLKKPIEIINKKCDEVYQYFYKKYHLISSKIFENEYLGKVYYYIYDVSQINKKDFFIAQLNP